MFNLERGGDAVATLRQPQHVDEADRVRSGRGRNGVWKALEASLSKRAASVKSTAVIGGDPHIVTEGMAEVAQPGLDFGVRAIGFALRGGCLVEPACLRSGMFQSAEPVVGRRCVILQRWRGIAARANVEQQSADRAEIVGEQLAVTVVEVEDAGAHGEKMIP